MGNFWRYLIEGVMFAIAILGLIKWRDISFNQIIFAIALILFLIFVYMLFVLINKIEKDTEQLKEKLKRTEELVDIRADIAELKRSIK